MIYKDIVTVITSPSPISLIKKKRCTDL